MEQYGVVNSERTRLSCGVLRSESSDTHTHARTHRQQILANRRHYVCENGRAKLRPYGKKTVRYIKDTRNLTLNSYKVTNKHEKLVLVFTGMMSAFLAESFQGNRTQAQQSDLKLRKVQPKCT